MTTPTDPRAVAAAKHLIEEPVADDEVAAIIAAEYAPLVEAARRAMRYFDEQESDEPGTTELRLTVLIALRAALEGSPK